MKNCVFKDKAIVMIYDEDKCKWIYVNDEKVYLDVTFMLDHSNQGFIIYANSKYLTEIPSWVKFVATGRSYRWRHLENVYALKFKSDEAAMSFRSSIIDNPVTLELIPTVKYSTLQSHIRNLFDTFEMSQAPPLPPRRATGPAGPPIPPKRNTITRSPAPVLDSNLNSKHGSCAPPPPKGPCPPPPPPCGAPPAPPASSSAGGGRGADFASALANAKLKKTTAPEEKSLAAPPPSGGSHVPPASSTTGVGRGADFASALANAKLNKTTAPTEKPVASPSPIPASNGPVDMLSEMQSRLKKRQQAAAEASQKVIEVPATKEVKESAPIDFRAMESRNILTKTQSPSPNNNESSLKNTSSLKPTTGSTLNSTDMEDLKKFIKEIIESEFAKLKKDLMSR